MQIPLTEHKGSLNINKITMMCYSLQVTDLIQTEERFNIDVLCNTRHHQTQNE